MEENNSKQISFRHCKRLQDSFCSETNPNLPSTNPASRSHRRFTDQLRNLPSVREGSNRRGGYVSTSLLRQPFPCCQTFRAKRPVINLRPFNRFVPNKKFRMESISLLKDILKPNSFLTKIDLKDAFYSIPIAKKSRKYLQFIYHNKLYQFCVLPFGISTAPRVFSNILKPVIALLRTRGISLIIYLDDLLIAYIECLNHTKQVISVLESLGFRINYQYFIIIPTQKLEVLGFIITSVPEKLCFKGSPILPHSVQSRGSPEPRSRNRPKVVADHLQYHSKTPILINDPDLIITSDASDLGWGAWCGEKQFKAYGLRRKCFGI